MFGVDDVVVSIRCQSEQKNGSECVFFLLWDQSSQVEAVWLPLFDLTLIPLGIAYNLSSDEFIRHKERQAVEGRDC